jgi:hypothetical protein
MPQDQTQTQSTALTVIVDDIHFLERGNDDEPRARDIDVAAFFGKTRARDIRKVIEANQEELEKNGQILLRARQARIDKKGATSGIERRDVYEYWLNEPQVYNIGALMRTPRAAELRPRMAALFAMVRQRTHQSLAPVLPESLAEIKDSLRQLNERIDGLHDVMVIPDRRLVRCSHDHDSLLNRLLGEACEVEARMHTLRRGKRLEPHQARLGVLRRVEAATRTGNIVDLEIEKWPTALLVLEKIIREARQEIDNHDPSAPPWGQS